MITISEFQFYLNHHLLYSYHILADPLNSIELYLFALTSLVTLISLMALTIIITTTINITIATIKVIIAIAIKVKFIRFTKIIQ